MSSSNVPTILCAGIAVQDIVFRVEQFPQPGRQLHRHARVERHAVVARLGVLAGVREPRGAGRSLTFRTLLY